MGAHALMFAVLETTCRTSATGFKRIPQTCTYNGVYLRSVPFDVVYGSAAAKEHHRNFVLIAIYRLRRGAWLIWLIVQRVSLQMKEHKLFMFRR